MQSSPIFAAGGARAFDETRAAGGAGDQFLALLNETAARYEEALPGYRETARPDGPRRDPDTRNDGRPMAPRRSEEPRETRPDRRDERWEAAPVGRDDARTRARDAGRGREQAERDVPVADAQTSAAARSDGARGTEPGNAATGDDGAPAVSDASPPDPHVPAATPDTAEKAASAALSTGETPLATQSAAAVQVMEPDTTARETARKGLGVAPPGHAAAPGSPATASGSTPGSPATASGSTPGSPATAPGATPDGRAATPAQPGAQDPSVPGTTALEAGKLQALAGSPASPTDGPKTDPSPAAAAVSSDVKRVNNAVQGPLSVDDIDPGAHKPAAARLDGRAAPVAQAGADQVPTNGPALAATAVIGQGSQKTGGTNNAAMRSELALAAAAKGTASATQAEGQMPAQPGLQTAPSAQAAARALGATPAAADRPSGPAAPIGEVAVHIHRAAATGEGRIRIQLHPAELGQIDVRLKLGADGITRAVVQVDRPETLDLLQRDARGLERALQDAGLKTDSNSLTFNLRDNGQGGLHERRGQSAGLEGGNDHADATESSDEVEPQIRPSLSSRALDISV